MGVGGEVIDAGGYRGYEEDDDDAAIRERCSIDFCSPVGEGLTVVRSERLLEGTVGNPFCSSTDDGVGDWLVVVPEGRSSTGGVGD